MFTDAHLRELRPSDWRDQLIGKGSFGAVYRATWRGKEVAVKELLLPKEPKAAGAAAREALKKRVGQITTDFVSEVEICCDRTPPPRLPLAHLLFVS